MERHRVAHTHVGGKAPGSERRGTRDRTGGPRAQWHRQGRMGTPGNERLRVLSDLELLHSVVLVERGSVVQLESLDESLGRRRLGVDWPSHQDLTQGWRDSSPRGR